MVCGYRYRASLPLPVLSCLVLSCPVLSCPVLATAWPRGRAIFGSLERFTGLLIEVRKRISFAMPFYTKMIMFTKTGSGQTKHWESSTQKGGVRCLSTTPATSRSGSRRPSCGCCRLALLATPPRSRSAKRSWRCVPPPSLPSLQKRVFFLEFFQCLSRACLEKINI